MPLFTFIVTSLKFRTFIITASSDLILVSIPLHEKKIVMIGIFENIDLSIVIFATLSFRLMYFQRLIGLSCHTYIFWLDNIFVSR